MQSYQKLLFALVFFHALVQERRWFGPIGFVNYGSSEWNDSDLETSIATLKLMLQQAQEASNQSISQTNETGIPLDALRYVVGEIHYGGRVTDEADRHLINVILARLFNEDITDPTFKFSSSGLYHAPADGQHDDYVKYINQLPEQAKPEVFGMHGNATLTLQQQLANRLIDNLNTAQPNTSVVSEGDAGSGEDLLLMRARAIASSIPALLDRSEGLPSLFEVNERGVMESLSVVLVQEIDRFNKLLRVISRTLSELERALKGEIALSSELDDVQACLALDKVPASWTRVSFLSMKPLTAWLADLNERVQFFRSWLIEGEPKVLWISAFFFPQGFLTAVLQRHARKHALPIDSLNWEFEVRVDAQDEENIEVLEAPEDGVIVRGLFMEGARWDYEEGCIQDSKPGELFAPLPPIHFKPVFVNPLSSPKAGSGAAPAQAETTSFTHALPVYKTSERRGVLSTTGQSTNFILPIVLPSQRPSSEWTLRGAACVTQLAA